MPVKYADETDFDLALTKEALAATTDEYGQSTNENVVDRAIIDAQSVIDSMLAPAGYDAPFTYDTRDNVPPMLRKLTVDIASYYLYGRTNEEMTVDNVRKQNHDKAIAYLTAVQAGTLTIKDLDKVDIDANAGSIVYRSGKRMFGKDLMKYL